ncbi:hypothetical protein [Candidatus Vidania fulgoroideorum]
MSGRTKGKEKVERKKGGGKADVWWGRKDVCTEKIKDILKMLYRKT